MMKHLLTTFLSALLLLSVQSSAFAQPAPDFSLPGDDKTISLKNLKGKVVYLDFWASWCTPCRKSFPWMNEMQARYDKDKFSIVAVNLDSSRREAESFLKKVPANFTIAYDPDGETAAKYKLKVMPSSFLIDTNGQLVFAHKGYRQTDADEIEQKIRRLLHSK